MAIVELSGFSEIGLDDSRVLDVAESPSPREEGFSDEPPKQPFVTEHGEVTVHGTTTHYALSVPVDKLNSPYINAYINGYGAFNKTMRQIADETAAGGSASLRWAPIRHSDLPVSTKLTDATRTHVDTLKAIVDDLPLNSKLRNLPHAEELSADNVNLAPHSYGGAIAVRYALERPGDVSSIVFLEAVGLENAGLAKFIPRIPKFIAKELIPFMLFDRGGMTLPDGAKEAVHIFSDLVQTIGEGIACTAADNRHYLPALRAQHIGLAILAGKHDNLIPASSIDEDTIRKVDYFRVIDTDHLGPQRKSARVSQAVIAAVHRLEARQVRAA